MWHRFGQDDRLDMETWRWTHVVPGDVVQSRGTCAYRLRDFASRDENTRILVLKEAPILVLSRQSGVPDESDPGALTFVCLSRHGLIVVVTHLS